MWKVSKQLSATCERTFGQFVELKAKQGGTDQKVVEANLLLFQEDEYGEGVAADAENSEYEHQEACTIYGGQGGRGCYL